MHGHQSGPWLLRLECMGTKWPLVGYVLNAWAPSGPWLVRLECMVTKCFLVGTS